MVRQMNWERARRNAIPAYVPTHLERRADRYLAAVSKAAGRPPASSPRLYLAVPYAEREAAKLLGARWDVERRKWWIPASLGRAPFAAWIEPTMAEMAKVAIADDADETPPWC